jgi:hypothetical protein
MGTIGYGRLLRPRGSAAQPLASAQRSWGSSLSLFKPTGSRASHAVGPGTWLVGLGEDLRVSSCQQSQRRLLPPLASVLWSPTGSAKCKSRPRDSPMEVPIGVRRGGAGAHLLPESRPRESPMEVPIGVCRGGGAQRNEMKVPAKMRWTVLPGAGHTVPGAARCEAPTSSGENYRRPKGSA